MAISLQSCRSKGSNSSFNIKLSIIWAQLGSDAVGPDFYFFFLINSNDCLRSETNVKWRCVTQTINGFTNDVQVVRYRQGLVPHDLISIENCLNFVLLNVFDSVTVQTLLL